MQAEELKPYMPQLYGLINDAFAAQDRSAYNESNTPFEEWQRLKSLEQLPLELGADGMAAIALADDDDTQDRPGRSPRPVAIACIKRWKGKIACARSEATKTWGPNEWEVTTCALEPGSRHRGQGLMGQCIDALVRHLRAAVPGYDTFVLWIQTMDKLGTTEYWERRGYVQQGEPDLAPVGTWGGTRPFHVVTLRKEVR